jgi:hypothetical protein
MSPARWHEIHRVIELIIDFSDGRSVLHGCRGTSRQWFEVVRDWPEGELFHRILYSVLPGYWLTWDLCMRCVPGYPIKRRPLTVHDVVPPRTTQGRTISVLLATHTYQPLAWLSDVPVDTTLGKVLSRATRAFGREELMHPEVEVYICSTRVHETTRLCDVQLAIKSNKGLRCDALAVLVGITLTPARGAPIDPVPY